MLAGLAFCEMLSQNGHGLLFKGSAGLTGGGESTAVCDPGPPRPFARYRTICQNRCMQAKSLGELEYLCMNAYAGPVFALAQIQENIVEELFFPTYICQIIRGIHFGAKTCRTCIGSFLSFLDHFSKQLSSVLGLTELCH